jgi:hypothetical protein
MMPPECTHGSTLMRMHVRIKAYRMYVPSSVYANAATKLRLYDCTYERTLARMYVRTCNYTNVRTSLHVYECQLERN